MATFTKIGDKISIDYDSGEGRIINNDKQVLYKPSGRIIITTASREYNDDVQALFFDVTDIAERPNDDPKTVAQWLVSQYFSDGPLGGAAVYVGEFATYTGLTTAFPAGEAERFAYVIGPEGTSWLPGSSGGTYYGAGWYYDTGSIWSNKNDAMFLGLNELTNPTFIDVNTLADLPAAVTGVITLKDNYTYEFKTNIDLLGSRLVGGSNTTILGPSSENASITSTGLGIGVPLFSSNYTTPVRHITFKNVDTAINFDGGATDMALDWTGVNFLNVPSVGNIKDAGNFIYSKGAFLNSKGLTFSSSFSTVSIDNSVMIGDGAIGDIVKVLSGTVVSVRFRIVYSSVIVFGSTQGLTVDGGAIVPDESFILDTVAFSGGGTFLGGLDSTSNKAKFVSCSGIGFLNTAVNGQMYMQSNLTETPIAIQSTFYKILGTTSASVDNSKYIHSDNRLTNAATVSRKYLIQCSLSFTSGNNKICEFGFYDSKLGTVRTPSRTKSTSNGVGRAENISLTCVVSHSAGDYIEIYCTNTTDTTGITVTDMNVVITEII